MQTNQSHVRPLLYAFCGVIAGAAIASITWGVLHVHEERDAQPAQPLLTSPEHYPNRVAATCPEGQLPISSGAFRKDPCTMGARPLRLSLKRPTAGPWVGLFNLQWMIWRISSTTSG